MLLWRTYCSVVSFLRCFWILVVRARSISGVNPAKSAAPIKTMLLDVSNPFGKSLDNIVMTSYSDSKTTNDDSSCMIPFLITAALAILKELNDVLAFSPPSTGHFYNTIALISTS